MVLRNSLLKNKLECLRHFTRLYKTKGGLSLWSEELDTNIKLKIEEHWKNEVLTNFQQKDNAKNIYVLPMFPYPSGNLHMGHVRVYSISDTLARFQSMSGNNVIHPMGWDAFGLPAENAAILHKIPPAQWTKDNIIQMKNQLLEMGLNFDWKREFSTCDSKYYKWTQYIFIKLYENGMAYQNKALVNWDPIDQTVLADEQVDEFGCSWRSGGKVEKRFLTQWFIRTTKFAKKLYEGLNDKSLENWKDIVNLQQHWIGPCNGVVTTFNLQTKSDDGVHHIDVWTSEPYKLIHCKFLVVSTENLIAKEHTHIGKNVKLPIYAYNPITDKTLPIYVTDCIEYPEGRDIYMADPDTSKQDLDLAKALNITTDLPKVNIDVETESQKAIDIAQKRGVGGYFVSSKLKDWLISRQRYWGTPIPIIHCNKCGTVPVPYSDLPVKLPDNTHSTNGVQTLKDIVSWVNCECPTCHGAATRETDTMDTFVDSSWYYYRFLDPHNEKMPFDYEKIKSATPVTLYVGGKEHAVLHLYYARFMSYFFHHLGWISHAEPFKKLLVQGMVMGKSYKVKSTGKYIPETEVEVIGKEHRQTGTGETLIVDWEKMSKSKFNGENPQNLLSTYGRDTTRLFMLSDVPPPTARLWSDATFPGVLNWQKRLWMTVRELLICRNNGDLYTNKSIDNNDFENLMWTSRNRFIATTTYYFKHTHMLSVGISQLHGLTKILRNNIAPQLIARSSEYELTLASLILMITPLAPHFCSELWEGLLSAPNRINITSNLINWNENVLRQNWPQVEDNFELSFSCKVDGADRCELKVKASELNKYTHDVALSKMLKQKDVTRRLSKGILTTQFDLFPGSRGILYIFTNRSLKKTDKIKLKK